MHTKQDTALSRALFIISTLGIGYTLRLVLRNLLYVDHYYFLTLNLRSLELRLPRTFDVNLTKITEQDIAEIRSGLSALDLDSRKELLVRLAFHEAGFKNGYIARTKAGELAHIQWLVYPDENDIIREHFSTRFYPVKDKHVMVENAFTYPKYRGLGLVQSVTYELLQKAKEKGARACVCYVLKSKIESINQFMTLGFKISEMLREVKFLRKAKRSLQTSR